MKSLPPRQGIRHALVKYLQYSTDRIKSAVLPLPILECFVYQTTPTLQLSDSGHFIECELTDSPKPNIRALQGKWVKIYRYTFTHKHAKRYTLVLDYFAVLPSTSQGMKDSPKNYADDPLVVQYLKIHQQYLEKEKINDFVDDLPSFDAIAMGTSSKQPVCLVSGKLTIPAKQEIYVRVGENGKKGCLDVGLDDIGKTCTPERVKISKGSKELIEVVAKQAIEEYTPQKEPPHQKIESPKLGTMEPDVSRGLAYLVSDFTPPTKRREIPTTQHDFMSSPPAEEIPASAEQMADVNGYTNRTIEPAENVPAANIGVGVYTEKHVEKLLQTRDKKQLSYSEQKADLLDMLKERSEEEFKVQNFPKTLTSAEFERYVSWRNFHKQVRSVNRKLEFDGFDLASSELVEFTVETKTGTESPLIESPAKRKKV